MVSEQDFYLLNGNRYRGSRYSNFSGGGVDPQGNVSSAINENANSSVGTAVDASKASTAAPAGGGTGAPSAGLVSGAEKSSGGAETGAPTFKQAASDLVIGAGIPFAAKTVGGAAGAALASGQSLGAGVNQGISALTNKVSGGLLGTSAASSSAMNATNSALSSMGGSYGPATSGAVNSAASKAAGGASVGGAVGSGLGTAVATLIGGGSIGDAAKAGVASGAGTYVGTAIGTAIGGPIGGAIGGFLGGTIGSIFCFTPETPIIMEDGSTKPVGDLRLGDVVMAGGMVTARGEAFADELYSYKGTTLTGSHAVFEDGVWMRVEDSEHAEHLQGVDAIIVCPVETEHHVLVTPWFVSADVSETRDAWDFTEDERIEILNKNEVRNCALRNLEKEFCQHGCGRIHGEAREIA